MRVGEGNFNVIEKDKPVKGNDVDEGIPEDVLKDLGIDTKPKDTDTSVPPVTENGQKDKDNEEKVTPDVDGEVTPDVDGEVGEGKEGSGEAAENPFKVPVSDTEKPVEETTEKPSKMLNFSNSLNQSLEFTLK